MGKCCQVVRGVGCTGILDWIDIPLCTFGQPDVSPCSVLVDVAGTTLEVVAPFARQREVRNSSLAAGCTVATVDSVDNAN